MRSYIKVIFIEDNSAGYTQRTIFKAPPRENDDRTMVVFRPLRNQLILALNNLAQESVYWQTSGDGTTLHDPWTWFQQFYAIEPYSLHPKN
jgi:hypothetical protein